MRYQIIHLITKSSNPSKQMSSIVENPIVENLNVNNMIESESESETKSKVTKPKFAGKYNKFKYFAHWFIEEMKSKDIISQEQGKAMLSELCFYGSVEEQNAVYSAFIDTNPKFSVTAINKTIREENKSSKPKKIKEVDPDAPQKKRGRKKKQVEDSSSEEEKLLSAIVSAKNAEFVEPIVEPELTEEPVIELSTPVVSEVVEETNKENVSTPVLKTVKKRVAKKKQITVTAEQLATIDRELVGEEFIEIELGDNEYQINASHVLFDLDDNEVGKIENGVVIIN
jgi:hypothetical protein